MIYLIPGEDFKEIESFDKDTVSTAKRNVLNEFVGGQLNTVIQRRHNLKEKLLEFGTIDIEAKAEEVLQNLSEIEEKIIKKTNQSQNLLEELLDLKEQETDRRLVFNKFQTLKSQYIADIKRLGLIVNGEEHFHELEENTLCPFCENPLPPEKQLSYLEAAQAELQRILSQLEGLEESIQDVQSQIDALQQKIQQLNQELLEIEQLLNPELTPQSENFKSTLLRYQQYIQLSQEFEFLSQYSDTLYDDLREATKIPERPKVYKPREHLPEYFLEQINRIAFQILEDCQYEGLEKSYFNPSTFDLEINGLIKEYSHGKGHWTFINTVLGLTFRSYLYQHAKFGPHLFIVDTPLLGMDQGVSDEAPESMRTALFQYFIRHQNEGQTIIIENTKDLPDLDYVKQGVKIFDFTNNKYQSKYENRAGFLFDIQK